MRQQSILLPPATERYFKLCSMILHLVGAKGPISLSCGLVQRRFSKSFENCSIVVPRIGKTCRDRLMPSRRVCANQVRAHRLYLFQRGVFLHLPRRKDFWIFLPIAESPEL